MSAQQGGIVGNGSGQGGILAADTHQNGIQEIITSPEAHAPGGHARSSSLNPAAVEFVPVGTQGTTTSTMSGGSDASTTRPSEPILTFDQLQQEVAVLENTGEQGQSPVARISQFQYLKRQATVHLGLTSAEIQRIERQLEEERAGRGSNSYDVIVGFEAGLQRAIEKKEWLTNRWGAMDAAIAAAFSDHARSQGLHD